MFDEFSKDLDQFKAEIKEKWLDYWEENQDLIIALGGKQFGNFGHNEHGKCYYFRPKPEIILSIASALEPKLKDFILLLTKLKFSSELDQIVQALELDGDVFSHLKHRQKEREKKQAEESKLILSNSSDTEYLDQFRTSNND